MADDVYGSESAGQRKHSLRYVQIVIRNVLGILNRILSLLRRKRFFVEDITLAFGDEGEAHVVLTMDGEVVDVQQAMHQLEKLHDVLSVEDLTDRKDEFFYTFYVTCPDVAACESFDHKPVSSIQREGEAIGVFMLKLADAGAFEKAIRAKGYHFRRRLVSLV